MYLTTWLQLTKFSSQEACGSISVLCSGITPSNSKKFRLNSRGKRSRTWYPSLDSNSEKSNLRSAITQVGLTACCRWSTMQSFSQPWKSRISPHPPYEYSYSENRKETTWWWTNNQMTDNFTEYERDQILTVSQIKENQNVWKRASIEKQIGINPVTQTHLSSSWKSLWPKTVLTWLFIDHNIKDHYILLYSVFL